MAPATSASAPPTPSAALSANPDEPPKPGTVVEKLGLGSTSINAGAIAVDATGNRYIVGSFRGTAHFDDIELRAKGEDAFILKLGRDGKTLWAKRFGGAGTDTGIEIALDASGLYMSGSFDSPTIEIGKDTHKNVGMHDVFLVKLDADGQVLWSKTYGDAADQLDMRLRAYPGGGVIATGWFSGAMGFTNLPTRSPFDKAFFVARIDSDGHGRWAHPYGHRIDFVGTEAAIDPRGNVFVSGGSDGVPDFKKGGFPSQVDDLGPVLVELDPDGKTISARRFGREAESLTTAIQVDANGNVRFASASRGVTSFDGDERKPRTGVSLVVAGFDPTGALTFHRELFTSPLVSIGASAIDDAGNFYVAGQYNAEDTARSTTRQAGYVAKITDTGQIEWTLKIMDGRAAWLSGIAFDPAGRLVAVGSVTGADPTFGNNELWVGTIVP